MSNMEQTPEPNDVVASMFTDTDLDDIEHAITQSKPLKISNKLEIDIAKLKEIELKLKLPDTIINGIIPIKIENIHDIFNNVQDILKEIEDEGTCTFFCLISYQYNFSSPMKGYKSGFLSIRQFENVKADGSFFLKVPLFLLPYSMNFVISVNCVEINLQCISKATTITIPSMLIDNKVLHIGDYVHYGQEESAYAVLGVITKLLEDDMVEIQTDNDYVAAGAAPLNVTVHRDQVLRDVIDDDFLVNLTNSVSAENELVLRNEDEKALDVYVELKSDLLDIYAELWFDDKIDYIRADVLAIPGSIGIHIYTFLKPKYNYRTNCVFDGFEMFGTELWQYMIAMQIDYSQRGNDTVDDVQSLYEHARISCDLCRCEVSYNSMIWRCINEDHEHDICLSCVNYMVQQYHQMQELLVQILDDVMNRDIIEEIVVFCVGRVNKFNVE